MKPLSHGVRPCNGGFPLHPLAPPCPAPCQHTVRYRLPIRHRCPTDTSRCPTSPRRPQDQPRCPQSASLSSQSRCPTSPVVRPVPLSDQSRCPTSPVARPASFSPLCAGLAAISAQFVTTTAGLVTITVTTVTKSVTPVTGIVTSSQKPSLSTQESWRRRSCPCSNPANRQTTAPNQVCTRGNTGQHTHRPHRTAQASTGDAQPHSQHRATHIAFARIKHDASRGRHISPLDGTLGIVRTHLPHAVRAFPHYPAMHDSFGTCDGFGRLRRPPCSLRGSRRRTGPSSRRIHQAWHADDPPDSTDSPDSDNQSA